MGERYNGWTNYATWRVNLEVFDGTTASDYVSGSCNIDLLCLALRQTVEELIVEGNTGLAVEYALAFIDGVNWREIAKHMVDDSEHDWAAETEASVNRELMGE